MEELDSENKASLTYDDFVDKLTQKLQDRESQKSTERVYELFVKDPNKTLNYETLKKVADEIGEELTEDQAGRIMSRIAKNGKTVDFDEFYTVMTKKTKL